MVSRDRHGRRRTLPGRPRRAAAARPAHAIERWRQLHEISTILTQFEGVERTFASVAALVATVVPLRSAVLVMQGHASLSTAVWAPREGSGAPRATARARAAFAYLTDRAARLPGNPGRADARPRFLALPLVVDHHKTFGVLQLEGTVRDEADLRFANAVANQLAVTLRRSEAEAERESLLVSERHARAEAEAANRAKDEFLAMLSHELRTPLNAITGWAHLMQAGALTAEQMAKAVDTICRNAGLQKQLIADILDVHSIVAGRLRLERRPVDLAEVVESAWDTLRPTAEAKRIEVRLALAPSAGTVTGDADRLRQVVWNLLSNAIKFTPSGGHVDVGLRAAARARVEITVSDDGPGIPKEFLAHVFDRFRQAETTPSRRHGGLGLGLAIAQKIVALHDGTVQAANGAGGGAAFVVSLPRRGRSASRKRRLSSAETAPPAVSLEGVRVLVVDDMADDREVVARLLEQQGAEVATAASAAQGFDVLQRQRPHVLVSDIGMPDEDGYAFLRRVRELPAARGGATPAAAVTAFAGADEHQHALAAGFHAHLCKPVDSRELARAVSALAARTVRRERR